MFKIESTHMVTYLLNTYSLL